MRLQQQKSHQTTDLGDKSKMTLEKQISELLGNAKTIAVVCNQWGDTGKGKLVDFLAGWADIIARGTGGANAGHTIVVNGKKHVFHLVPSGITYDPQGKINILGQGVAFDPITMKQELETLTQERLSFDNLMISRNAKLVLPQHIALDRLENTPDGQTKIGSTGRGIGPVYEDHVGRRGLVVNDLLNPRVFEKKLEANLQHNLALLRDKNPDAIKKVLEQKALLSGRFYDSKNILNIREIISAYLKLGQFFRTMISDTEDFLATSVSKRKILLEGAQGFLLSYEHGTHPFVTSSDCSIQGLVKGVGLSEKDVERIFGIVKAFYMTRVGEGPFPTEFSGTKSAEWCRTHTRQDELQKYPNPDINITDEFEQGIAARVLGGEYGATTGRPRRTGWLDLPLLRSATRTNGPELILTKVDVLSGCERIKVCVAYKYTGMYYQLGNETLKTGTELTIANTDPNVLSHCIPIYREFPGWQKNISDIREYSRLPQNLQTIIRFIEEETDTKVRIISVGPERDQTIIRN